MKKLFKNIKFRLLAWLCIFLCIVFYLFGYMLISLLKKSHDDLNTAILSTAIKDLKHDLNTENYNQSEFEDIKDEFNIDVLYAQIIVTEQNETKIIVKSKDLKTYELPFNLLDVNKISNKKILFSELSIEGLSKTHIKLGIILLEKGEQNEAMYLLCAIPFNKKNIYIEKSEIFLWIGLALLLCIVLIIAYFMISKSLSATKSVVDAVKKIHINGKSHHIASTHISSEIDELIGTFNMLIQDLQTSYHKVKDFGQNASHELKTPLTIMRGEIEVGLRKERANDEYKIILQSIMGEVDQLQEVIEKILFLSGNADADIIKNFEEVYLDEIVSEVIQEKTQLALTKSIKLNIVSLEPLTKLGNATLLKIAITNLLENAIKYSYENSRINLTLNQKVFIIEDFGCGISENEIEKIFDRFYRVSKSKNLLKGYGLGLSITKTILNIHNFTIKIESAEEKYTKVIVSF